MSSELGELVCFDERTRHVVEGNLDWADVEHGRHCGCGNPIAIDVEAFEAYGIETQQRIWDSRIHWKFYPEADAEAGFKLKRLSRPWAEGEVLRMINRSG